MNVRTPAATNECVDCHKRFGVEPNELKWKFVCDNCFGTHEFKKCSVCDRNLGVTSKKWQRECTSCWLAKRAQTHATCPLCPPQKATLLRRKIGETACKDCLKAIGEATIAMDQEAAQRGTPGMPAQPYTEMCHAPDQKTIDENEKAELRAMIARLQAALNPTNPTPDRERERERDGQVKTTYIRNATTDLITGYDDCGGFDQSSRRFSPDLPPIRTDKN